MSNVVAADDLSAKLQKRLLAAIPRIIALLDKNPLSKTYGCFDRKYWHYKISDFSSGMQQELVFPLAFLWKNEFPGNHIYNNARFIEYIKASFDFHACLMHKDGSLDDYFPYERALGATAYALAALVSAASITGAASDSNIAAFERSAIFIASWPERGLLSNHLAIAAAALAQLSVLAGTERWFISAQKLVRRLDEVQHSEGWFPEYGGCDLGYQTVTIEFLARYEQITRDATATRLIERALPFLRRFLHPDGSFGGEYGSRNTYNFYPGGFALLSRRYKDAAEMLGGFAASLDTTAEGHLADDGVFGHLLSSYATTLNSGFAIKAPQWGLTAIPSVDYFPGSGLFAGQTGSLRIYGGCDKGGVVKIFRGVELRLSDTGFAGRFMDGEGFSQNVPGAGRGQQTQCAITVQGELQRFRSHRLDPVKLVMLRALSIAFGRWSGFSHLVRAAMQRRLILARSGTGLRYQRRIVVAARRVTLDETLENASGRVIASLFRSTDCVNTHVITSDSFQQANLIPWTPVTPPQPGETQRYVKTIEEVE